MVHTYGMAKMIRRTTFALDELTVLRLKKLAAVWHVSQAEVVRKVIKKAESELAAEAEEKIGRLRQYHKRSNMKIEAVNTYLDEVEENRSDWGG